MARFVGLYVKHGVEQERQAIRYTRYKQRLISIINIIIAVQFDLVVLCILVEPCLSWSLGWVSETMVFYMIIESSCLGKACSH